jgi:hypothetical protein
MRYTILLGMLVIFWVGCSSEIEPLSPHSQSIQDHQPFDLLSSMEHSPENSKQLDTTAVGLNSDCDICIDPPGDGDPVICTPSDQYRLEASVNGNGAYIYNSNIPTWRFSPFWGGIIQTILSILENTGQNDSPYHREFPYHEVFDLDRRVTVVTTLTPSGNLNFSVTLYNKIARIWFSSTSAFVSNLQVRVASDAIQISGTYTIANDSFSITNFEFENLDVDINLTNGLHDWLVDLFGIISQAEGAVESAIKNEIATAIDNVNRNSPNMFVRSLIDYPEISNKLPLLDQAITELLQDDVSAELNIELPSCGDIVRDGLIQLAVSTN